MLTTAYVLLAVMFLLLFGWVWMLDKAVHNVLDLLNDIAGGNRESGQEDTDKR